MEVYVDDDTTCHPQVGETLRAFLPKVFEGKFEPGREPEMEWVRPRPHILTHDPIAIMIMIIIFLDGHYGLHSDRRSIRTSDRPHVRGN